MTLFIVSAAVALLSSIFNIGMVRAYRREYDKRARAFTVKANTDLPHGMSTDVIGSWLGRVADVSSNFPAVVLTIVAFADIRPFSSGGMAMAFLLIVAVAFVMATFLTDGPAHGEPWSWELPLGKRSYVPLSIWSLILIALNVLGLVLVASIPGIHK